MNEPHKAAFSFENFRIPSFYYQDTPSTSEEVPLKLKFNPSGNYNPSTGIFEVVIDFVAHDEGNEEDPITRVMLEAFFKFSENTPLESIPDFFYKNSIAIAFPYLRAFLTTLTIQANIRQMILPVMNLTSLEPALKENTTVISE